MIAQKIFLVATAYNEEEKARSQILTKMRKGNVDLGGINRPRLENHEDNLAKCPQQNNKTEGCENPGFDNEKEYTDKTSIENAKNQNL